MFFMSGYYFFKIAVGNLIEGRYFRNFRGHFHGTFLSLHCGNFYKVFFLHFFKYIQSVVLTDFENRCCLSKDFFF